MKLIDQNRNWRQRMQAAADQWMQTSAGRVLAEAPLDPARLFDGLRDRVRQAYLAGCQDGENEKGASHNAV